MDAAALRQLYQRIQDLEALGDGALTASDAGVLRAELASCAGDPDPFIAHLADLTRLVREKMTVRELYHLSVPIERALRKTSRDDQFMIASEDRPQAERATFPVFLIVENLRSAFNVGSLFRTCDGLGAEKIHLVGYTPTPEHDVLAKTSLGAQNVTAWTHAPRLEDHLRDLRAQGVRLVALETSPRALEVSAPFPRERTAFVLGNERFGLSAEALALCDEVRFVPMHGVKNSLNVGVAAGIALYEWIRQWKSAPTKP